MAAAALGVFGPQERTVSATTADGRKLSVTYPSVVRSGMEIDVTITASDTPSDLRLLVTSDMFSAIGIDHVSPAPSDEVDLDTGIAMVFADSPHPDRQVVLSGRLPTEASVGRTSVDVALIADSESTPVELTSLELTFTVLP